MRLQCYPPEDGEFSSGVTLEIDVPEGSPLADQVISKLRARYPGVAIRIEESEASGPELTWHVYRDGLPQ